MNAASTPGGPARRRARWTAGVATLAGLMVLAGAALTAFSWRAELPDPVASHWGAGGGPDGFTTLDALVRALLITGAVLVLGFGAITWLLGQSALTRRIGVGGAVWSALFLSTLMIGSLNMQRGLTDAHNAGGVSGVLAIALGGAAVVALVVGAVIPGDPHQPTIEPVDPHAPRATVPISADPMWTGTATSPAALVAGMGAGLIVGTFALLTQVWVLLVLAVLVAVLIASMSSIVVRLGSAGVDVRSTFGWPRMHIALDEIVRADATQVQPLRDFGGWGWRVGRGGRVGVALRRGEALLIERTGGRSVVITVDGAATAAGMLNSLADRVRH